MSLFYCMIVRQDQTILSEYQLVSANFAQVFLPLIAKLEPGVKDSFDYNKEYTIHYLNEHEVTFLCMSDITFSKILAYGFLEEVSKEFFENYQDSEIKQCSQYALNYAFYDKIDSLIQKFNGNLSKETKTELKRIYNKTGDHNESVGKLLNKEEMFELSVYKPVKDSLYSRDVLAEEAKYNHDRYKKIVKKALGYLFLLVLFGVIGYLTLTTICKGIMIPECLGYYDNF